ncbi:uncharacterized protein MELLADRAFT_111351 [Melampsora larici-populina 98AG31]|uniref:Uncharacterized protein n=1 Tax=Melampsora larici-populina (strain 98AG31 / pathotype 3-4-7) TaxID=747676 RepID=F4S2X9_MELLP|nr:uncharacterized protein MELLADRAFT_111351 [Melampsora larici-populina 98AG31]EGG00880.1 hypothetical protein MELLADRAFT_111351 [Melampsora larici-populina 98AG31]
MSQQARYKPCSRPSNQSQISIKGAAAQRPYIVTWHPSCLPHIYAPQKAFHSSERLTNFDIPSSTLNQDGGCHAYPRNLPHGQPWSTSPYSLTAWMIISLLTHPNTPQCPTPDNDHNWKTWRCDQLNHELALINLGEPRPIISKIGDWGPRVSPFGQVLRPAPDPQPGHPYHPFLHRSGVTTPNGRPPRSKPNVICKRPLEGPLSQSHKTAANKECPSQYCLGCCQAFGSPLCRRHPRASASTASLPSQPNQDNPMNFREAWESHVSEPSAASGNVNPTPRRTTKATASQARPHQWAQTSNSLGRRVPHKKMVMLQQNREQRDHAAQRQLSSLIDESKLVTIELWLDPVKPKAITALFPFWPKCCFSKSTLLVHALQSAHGPNWNRALIFWDEKIGGWRDTLDSYPHRFDVNQRTIVVRLPTVEVPISAVTTSTKSKSSPKKAPASAFLSSLALPPIYDMPSSPMDGSPIASTSQRTPSGSEGNPASKNQVKAAQAAAQCSVEVPSTPPPGPITSSTTPPNGITIDLTISPDEQVKDVSQHPSNDDTKPLIPSLTETVTTSPIISHTLQSEQSFEYQHPAVQTLLVQTAIATPGLQNGWPLPIPVSSLVVWYDDCTKGGIPKAEWHKRWGAQWKFVIGTMYRYRAFVKEVGKGPITLGEHYCSQPEATVADAREFFHKEFNQVAKLNPITPIKHAHIKLS